MIVMPSAVPVANPGVPGLFAIVATWVDNEAHATILVKSCVLPSLYVPVAVNCCIVPNAIAIDCGLTVSEIKTTEFTVRLAVPVMLPLTTLITVLPPLTAVAWPCEPVESLIVAIFGANELQ